MSKNPLAKYKPTPAVTDGAFDSDAWHTMQARDDQMIRDTVLHGYSGAEYVYKFNIQGKEVTGVSVVGARELASLYGGIKHRIVASVDKTGSLFVFKSFEPLAIQAQMIPQLDNEPDFYEVVIEIQDIKTGNSIQVRKKESKTESRRDGSSYDRPHFDVIAESKAFRNGVLSIIPQSVIRDFKERALKSGKGVSQEKTLDQLRDGVIAFAAKNAIGISRQAVGEMLFAEINGLGTTAKEGVEAFRSAADALGILDVKNISIPSDESKKFEFTQADVEAAMKNAKSADELNVAADMMRSAVADPQQHEFLENLYAQRLKEFNP